MAYAYQMSAGVDLSEIPGVGTGLILSLTSEIGFNLKDSFPTYKHFSSWLGFAPNNKISGGKVLSSKTPKIHGNIKKAFMDAANAAGNSQTPLGDFFRRIAYRKGRPVAIVATARKIAIAIFVMLDKKVAYQYSHSQKKQEKLRKNQLKNLKKKLSKLKLSEAELAEMTANSTS